MVDPRGLTDPARFDAACEAAIAWHLRVPELSGPEWEAFVGWLEASPDHRDAYEQVALADALASEGLQRADGLLPVAPPKPGRAGRFGLLRGLGDRSRKAGAIAWRRGLVAGAAAGLAAIVAVGFWPQAEAPLLEQTRAGLTKQLDFADGTRIDLNGETALALDQADLRHVELRHGEARFSVEHGARPFNVTAGGFVLRDLGTVFNVRLNDRTLVLDVTEGAVLFDPGGAEVRVEAGERLAVDRQRNLVLKRDDATPGDWIKGELAFDRATLSDVTDALHRRYGINILLSSGLQGQPFTGNVRFTGDPARDVPHLARLIGADYRREAQGWIIAEVVGRR